MTAQFKAAPTITRHWHASLTLGFALRRGVTRMVENIHCGPLRVLKPFYPEADCCHVYLLHPPGGLVLGDELRINVQVDSDSLALVTTPSAGKVYGVKNAAEKQQQRVSLSVATGACLEWLPQETIVFNGANALLQSDIQLQADAKLMFWDMVCFGRPANQLTFDSGECVQMIRIVREGIPLLIERNLVKGGGALQASAWGLGGHNSMGTFIMTLRTVREQRQELTEMLEQTIALGTHAWGLTQKDDLFIARYLGDSASHCRRGFELLWQTLRPLMINKPAVSPRIWFT
ncbi:MAG TPA: urease accessory protein UreD [Cellvibrio sp.]|nr:urease accessory protein UreD [Cellvibrio sp.]